MINSSLVQFSITSIMLIGHSSAAVLTHCSRVLSTIPVDESPPSLNCSTIWDFSSSGDSSNTSEHTLSQFPQITRFFLSIVILNFVIKITTHVFALI